MEINKFLEHLDILQHNWEVNYPLMRPITTKLNDLWGMQESTGSRGFVSNGSKRATLILLFFIMLQFREDDKTVCLESVEMMVPESMRASMSEQLLRITSRALFK